MKAMSVERGITFVRKVIHLPPEGRSEAHRHIILWKDGGQANEDFQGAFSYIWSDGGWVLAEPKEQELCRGIVSESEKKRGSFWSRARR